MVIEMKNEKGKRKNGGERIAIKIEDLSYTYPDETVALKGIDLAVGEGESLVVVGPNGAGKSTLLLTLNGTLKGEGLVQIRGLSIDGQNLKEIRKLVGMVFQDPEDQLFMPTVFDDIAFGPLNMDLKEDEIRKKVKEALKAVEMEGFEARLSHHLSFGEKKLVSIATVLAMEPEIIVIDEPTANLDPHARRHLIQILKSLPQTKVIATHDMNFAYQVANQVAVLYKGKIVASGNKNKILTDEPLLLKYDLELPTNMVVSS